MRFTSLEMPPMPFDYKLDARWRVRGWKVKIREKERCEPPHVSIIFKVKCWRVNLRTKKFLEKDPAPGDVPLLLLKAIYKDWAVLIDAWNTKYPGNKV